uniref:Putative secreted protein n=1 Tax=Anopheles darlingi TaxID=43151 RepID=A0A2M4DJ24_ANODA
MATIILLMLLPRMEQQYWKWPNHAVILMLCAFSKRPEHSRKIVKTFWVRFAKRIWKPSLSSPRGRMELSLSGQRTITVNCI